MARVAVTSIVREAATGEPSGYLRVLDLSDGRVLVTARVPDTAARAGDPNPRGGLRGAKGISAIAGRLVLARTDCLFVWDSSWRALGRISHPWFSAIHDLHAEDDGVWVAATNADVVAKIGWDGKLLDHWCWRDDTSLVRALGFRRVPPFERELDFRRPAVIHSGVHNIAHVNAIVPDGDSLLVSLGRVLAPKRVSGRRARAVAGRLAARVGIVRRRRGPAGPLPAGRLPGSSFALVRLERGTDGSFRSSAAELLVLESGIDVPNHNVLADGDLLVYNDTNRNNTTAYDLGTRSVRSRVPVPGAPGFVRGLARLPDGRHLVGSQRPAAIHAIDLDAQAVTDSFELGGDPRESVYAVCVLPASFAEPPGRLSFDPEAVDAAPATAR